MSKRLFDLAVSCCALVLLSPLLLGVALAIKLEDGGPVFYRGERVGRRGRLFRIFKFRSMVPDSESLGAASTSDADRRITRVGRWLRKYKLDELPQLINVVTGEMSLVGPRPQVKWAVDGFSAEERQVLELRPGLTDWASIRFHNEGEILAGSGIADPDEAYLRLIHPEKMRLQLAYLRERGLCTDLEIIRQTLATLFVSRLSRRRGDAPPGEKSP